MAFPVLPQPSCPSSQDKWFGKSHKKDPENTFHLQDNVALLRLLYLPLVLYVWVIKSVTHCNQSCIYKRKINFLHPHPGLFYL